MVNQQARTFDSKTAFTKLVGSMPDLADALASHQARRILIVGPPGCGQSELAEALGRNLGIAEVRCADDLIATYSLTAATGGPTQAELNALAAGEYVRAWLECALFAEVRRWLAAPGPWIIEGSVAMHGWSTALYRSGAPAGVDAAILCSVPTVSPRKPWVFVARRREIGAWWEEAAPDVVFAGGLLRAWVPPNADAHMAALAARLKTERP